MNNMLQDRLYTSYNQCFFFIAKDSEIHRRTARRIIHTDTNDKELPHAWTDTVGTTNGLLATAVRAFNLTHNQLFRGGGSN